MADINYREIHDKIFDTFFLPTSLDTSWIGVPGSILTAIKSAPTAIADTLNALKLLLQNNLGSLYTQYLDIDLIPSVTFADYLPLLVSLVSTAYPIWSYLNTLSMDEVKNKMDILSHTKQTPFPNITGSSTDMDPAFQTYIYETNANPLDILRHNFAHEDAYMLLHQKIVAVWKRFKTTY